jgi:hypothetical protein
LAGLVSWLQVTPVWLQLFTAGLNPPAVLNALDGTVRAVAAWQKLQARRFDTDGASTDVQQQQQQQQDQGRNTLMPGGAVGGQGEGLAGQLRALGVCLSSLPLSWGCNNPLCTNSQGPAEALIVQGKGLKCTACRKAYYCVKACQEQHWKQHKPVCKAVVAAAATAAAPFLEAVVFPDRSSLRSIS